MRAFTPEERLIVAADFKPVLHEGALREVWKLVLGLAASLSNLGVYLKINSALRACGYDLIDEIHAQGLRVFADLKLYDIPETLSIDGKFLRQAQPELLTATCAAGEASLKALREELPNTEVLGVTVLTSMRDGDSYDIFGKDVLRGVWSLAKTAQLAGLGGIICSPKEAEHIRDFIGSEMTINTPAIRPEWAIVSGDDQNPERIMTPRKAIKAGVTRIVVGRPITQASNPYDAVMRTIDEIASATGGEAQ